MQKLLNKIQTLFKQSKDEPNATTSELAESLSTNVLNATEAALLAQYGECISYTGPELKLLFIADTHGVVDLKDEELIKNEQYNAIFLLGDHYYNDLSGIIRIVPDNIPVYGILGNHNTASLYTEFNQQNQKMAELYGRNTHSIIQLDNGVYDLLGIKIAIFAGSSKYKESPDRIMFSQDEMKNIMQQYPHADIVLSHDGPAPSQYRNHAHYGFEAITEYIYKEHIPYCIHGHNHTTYQRKLANNTIDICVYQSQLITLAPK